MMKKLITIFLSMLLVLLIFGCSTKRTDYVAPVTFYYPELPQEDGSIANVMRPEIREGAHFSGDLMTLLETYLAGPDDNSLYAPVPDHVMVTEASVSDGKVTIIFSESFAELSGLERSIACSCISLTCMDFTGAEEVEIFAENTLFDGEESILISRENLLTQDNTPIDETK